MAEELGAALAAELGIENAQSFLDGPDFVPASHFEGACEGFHFKLGPQGLGYYRDMPCPVAVGADLILTGSSSEFIEAACFSGARLGFVFKRGEQGVGYYRDDAVPAVSTAAADGLAFVSAVSFGGARSGYVFKRGPDGVGYYRDDGLFPGKRAGAAANASRRRAGVSAGHGSRSAPSAGRGRGFVFGGGSEERAFRNYCERAVMQRLLSTTEVDALYTAVEDVAEGDQGATMLRLMHEGLRGMEVLVSGATGRTPRGWWGDESPGRVLRAPLLFDASRPDLLPVRVPLRASSASGSTKAQEGGVPEVMDVGIPPIKLRLRPSSATPPPPSPAITKTSENLIVSRQILRGK